MSSWPSFTKSQLTDGKAITLWAGLGNRAGLYGFTQELLQEKWQKSGKSLLAKLKSLPKGTEVEVRRFRSITRERGRWVRAFTIKLGGK